MVYISPVHSSLLLFAIVPFVLVVFVSMWCLIPLLLSRIGGWSRLAERFSAPKQPEGKRFRSENGRLGWVNYNHCLTIYISKAGLHLSVNPVLRVGHRPILIPWREIHDVQNEHVLWGEYVSFQIGSPTMARLRLSKRIFDEARPLLE